MEKHKFNLYPEITGNQYEELKKSISNGYDSSFPIIIYQGYVLDGWNRHLVCKELGIDAPTKYFEGDDVEAIQHVIRSNNRRDLDVSQRAAIASEYKPLFEEAAKERMSLGGGDKRSGVETFPTPIENKGRSRDQAGNMFSVSGRIVQDADLIKEKNPELFEEVKKGNKSVNEAKKEIRKEERIKEDKELASQYTEDDAIKLYVGDFYELCKNIPDDSIDLILTDPPYPQEFIRVWSQLGEVAARVLKPSGFLVSYSGQLHLPRVIQDLSKHLTYYWTFDLRHHGAIQIVNARNTFCNWKPILIYQKEPFKKLDKPVNDFVDSTREKDLHEWQQSLAPAEYLIECFSKPNDLILDAFGGSGTFALAAKNKQRRCIIMDIDESNIIKMKARLMKNG